MLKIHALRMFTVNTFGDVGIISGRTLHQIGKGVYTSQRSRIIKTATYTFFWPLSLELVQTTNTEIDLSLSPRGKSNDRRSKLECDVFSPQWFVGVWNHSLKSLWGLNFHLQDWWGFEIFLRIFWNASTPLPVIINDSSLIGSGFYSNSKKLLMKNQHFYELKQCQWKNRIVWTSL